MGKKSLRFVEIISIPEKIFYGVLFGIFYFFKYITLLPYFVMNQTFIKKPSVEKSSICITENNGEKVFRNINSTDNLLTGFQNYKSLSEILMYLNYYFK